MSTHLSACFFCDFTGRSDNRRRHCKAFHTAEDVIGRKLANNLCFRRDTERDDLLVSLKAEGSRMNCGYCFACNSEVDVPMGTPNALGKIQNHSCREHKERKKKGTTTEMPTRTPTAPSSCLRITEDEMNRLNKEVIPFETEYHDDLEMDLKKSYENFQAVIKKTVKQVKTLESAPQIATGGGMLSQVQTVFSAKFPKLRAALKRHIDDALHHAQDLVDSDDEDGYDEDAEKMDIIVYAMKSALDIKEMGAKERKAATEMSATYDEKLTQREIELAELTAKYNTLRDNYVAQSHELSTAIEKVRQLETPNTEGEVITHLP